MRYRIVPFRSPRHYDVRAYSSGYTAHYNQTNHNSQIDFIRAGSLDTGYNPKDER